MSWTGEHPLSGEFAALEAGLRGVLDGRVSTFSRESAQDAITQFLRLRNQLDAAYLHLLRTLDDLSPSPAEVTRFLTCSPNHLSRGQAARDVEAAKASDPSVSWDGVIGGSDGDRGALQHLGDALAAGEASRAHLDVAVRALAVIPTPIRRGTTTDADPDTGEVVEHRNAELLDAFFTRHAATHCPRVAHQLARELVLTLDPEHEDRTYRDPAAAARRGLVVGPLSAGMRRLTADLDESAAVIVVQAIAAAAAPLPAQTGEHGETVRDPRSKRQRDVDALVTLVQRGAAASEPAIAETARVTVVATVQDVQAALDHRSGQITATAEGHGPVSTTAFGSLTCGATLRRVLTSPAGAVLDLGRSHRLASPHQRTALAVRDGGCVAPGCAIAPWACEAHHFPEWEHGGATDLDSMVLLCPGHHRAWHARHLEVRLRPDRTVEARWVHWSDRSGEHPEEHPWVKNTYPTDRALTRALGACLRASGTPSPELLVGSPS